MAKVQTSFAAVPNGFEFVNYFEIKLPVRFQLPLVGTIDLNEVVFGLCGGMCYTALDYFYTQNAPWQYATPQQIQAPLMSYLCERQVDSLTIPVLLQIINWMAHGDDELASRMVRSELPKLRRSLDAGKPAVLCLIRTQGAGDPTHNHQVVATGYDLNSVPGSMVISLYDPNHPGETPTITAGLTQPGFSIRQSTGEELRGLFLMPYSVQKNPPLKPASQPKAEVEGTAFDLSAEPAVPEPPFRLRWPVDSRQVNQMFGENPATYKPFGLAGHEGIDFYAPTSAKVYAAFEGVVSEAKYRGAYGNQVRIRHEHNGIKFTTVYAHLQTIFATPNQQVSAGDLIGAADNTGNSRGSHLHFTLFVDGAKTPGYYDGIVDPWLYFEGNEPPPPPTLSGVVAYAIKDVNLRSLPSATADIITLLPAGEELPVFGDAADVKRKIGQKDQWLQVKTGGEQTGYIAAWLASDTALQAFPPSGLIVYPYDILPMRSGPGLGLAQVGVASATIPLNVLGSADSARAKIGQKDQWLQALAPDGTRGFVPAWLVRITGDIPPATGVFVTPTAGLNLRAAPAKDADIMVVVMPGDLLKVVGDKTQTAAKIGLQDQWLNVQAPNGVVGWVAAWFVTNAPSPSSLPATHTPVTPPPGSLSVYPTPEIGVNLRATPDVDSARVDGALKNEALTVLDADLSAARAKIGRQDQWLYTQKTNGKRGWVAAWFVSMTPL